MKKKLMTVLATLVLAVSMTACGNADSVKTADKETQTVQESGVTEQEKAQQSTDQNMNVADAETEDNRPATDRGDGTDTLVVVFSATGTTKGVAEKIAAIEGADLYEIIPAEPYTDADLNWNDKKSRTTLEQNDQNSRPEIGSERIDLSGYSKIYIGYPIWWGEEPRIMDTFVESYDFGNATMIPFCTSGSSGIGRSGKNLAEKAGSGNWLDGGRLNGSISEEKVKNWIENLN
ncbi:MAG: flavodoxin [Lachnospiraceae bacterium]|nr:flavodoxin [Lachnospiraceae bacterium]